MGSDQIQSFEATFEAFIALTLLVTCAATAHPLAATITERHRASYRWCATAVIASWLLTLLFLVLVAFSAFRLPVVVGVWVVLAVAVQSTFAQLPGIRDLLASDFRALLRLVVRPPSMLLSIAGLTLCVPLAARLAIGLVSPPLGWDGLTYHLLKAGRWVQRGGWVRDPAPDAWGYYEYFPPGGDLLWAYAMLPGRSDSLLPIAGMLVVVVCALAAYGASRALGSDLRSALGTALAISAMPTVSAFVTSTYVATLMLAELLLGLTFLILVVRYGRVRDGLLAVAALALAAGIQAAALPLMAAGTAIVLAATWWHHRAISARYAAGLCVACAPGLIGYVVAWVQIGSPLYPFTVTVAGHTVWPGNELLEGILSGRYLGVQLSQDSLWAFARALFHGRLTEPFHGLVIGHINLGAGSIPLIVLAFVGLWQLRRRPEVATILVFVALPVAAILSDGMLSQRTAFVAAAGRFVAPSMAALAVVGSVVSGRAANCTRSVAILLGAAYSLPAGIPEVQRAALYHLLPFMLGGAITAVLVLGIGWARRKPAQGLAVGMLILIVVAWSGVRATRAVFRYPIYRAAAGAPPVPYDLHPLASPLVAWRIWQALDDGSPYRIAFAAAWDGYAGHTWYRYPLLGSRLQNTVLYVPPTRDGEVVDYRRLDLLVPKADFRAWLRRLIQERIDVVVMGPPDTPELTWMRNRPSIFIPLEPTNVQGFATHAFRIDTASAQLLVQ